VHLIRHPVDNIVARMHYRQKQQAATRTDSSARDPLTSTGTTTTTTQEDWKAYCHYIYKSTMHRYRKTLMKDADFWNRYDIRSSSTGGTAFRTTAREFGACRGGVAAKGGQLTSNEYLQYNVSREVIVTLARQVQTAIETELPHNYSNPALTLIAYYSPRFGVAGIDPDASIVALGDGYLDFFAKSRLVVGRGRHAARARIQSRAAF
jgi:hypothetical protein